VPFAAETVTVTVITVLVTVTRTARGKLEPELEWRNSETYYSVWRAKYHGRIELEARLQYQYVVSWLEERHVVPHDSISVIIILHVDMKGKCFAAMIAAMITKRPDA
jgi:hypothetical protein